MKRCPKCRRAFSDDRLRFCPEDGARLAEGDRSDGGTAILTERGLPLSAVGEAVTRELPHDSHSTGATNSIAVLPFVNMSPDVDNEYFCDGLAEELLNALAKIADLKVAARTSSFSFKGKNMNIAEIGRTLNVRTILEGSVRKERNRVRITIQLDNVADGYHIWSDRYDREMSSIFDIQDEIALAVVDALKLKLLGYKKKAILKRYTENLQAYELLLKGRFHAAKVSKDGYMKAVEYFDQALAIDPEYARAYAFLANAYGLLGRHGHMDPKVAMPKAETALLKALELDDELAEAHNQLAVLKVDAWEWAAAETSFKRALDLNPNLATARSGYAIFLSHMGRHDEAIAEIERAAELDPLRLSTLANMGITFYFARRYDEAEAQLNKTLELDESFGYARELLAYTYDAKEDFDRAIAEYRKFQSINGKSMSSQCYLGYALARGGHSEEAAAIRKELEDTEDYVSPAELAAFYAGSGENELAFSALERAYDVHDPQLQFLGIEPHYDSLRSDPRFEDLLRRVGLIE